MMLNIISRTTRYQTRVPSSSHLTLTIRHASLNSAIGRGIRRSQSVDREDRRDNNSPRSARQYERSNNPNAAGTFRSKFGDRDGSNLRQYFRNDYESRQRADRSAGTSFRRPFRNDHESREPRPERRERKYENQSDELSFKSHDRREPAWPGNESQFARRARQERPKEPDFDEDEFIRSGNFRALPREHQSRFQPRSHENQFPRPGRERPSVDDPMEKQSKSRAHRVTSSMPERVKENVKVPDTIPYTTPASEFIYGTSAVEAALRCSRRQIYKLYIYQAAEEDLSPAKITIRKLALSKNIAVKMAFAGWDRLMDKMSAGRPHNGCILEASPLPKLPVRGFQAVPSISEEYFRAELAPQTREEAAVNGTDDRIPIHHPPPPPHDHQQAYRYPVALLLDGVVDPGNMGAIIRSSYFLGIDAIVLAGRNSAPLSPVTIKASAGAAENMTILHVKNEVDFIQRSKENGWRFYAADAPGPGSVYLDHAAAEGDQGGVKLPFATAPSVLMMGSEGSGLSSHIKSHANATVSIPGARHSPVLGVTSDPARIDSLNVSVAAALLMEKFLRTPVAVAETVKKEKNDGRDKMW